MSTASNLIDRCNSLMHSYTGVTEQVTYLTTAATSSDTTLLVKNFQRVTRGMIEVGDELMRVDEVTDSSVDLLPDGRGEAGSTAVSHPLNARVTVDPMFPRIRIFEAVKDTLRQVQPDLYAVKTTTLAFSPVVNTYELPADVDRVLRVHSELIGPTGEWMPVRNWRLDEKSTATSGKSLVITELIDPGTSIQVVYAAPLSVPTTTSVDLDATGVSPEIQEVVLYGACWRLSQFLEFQRLDLSSVEQQARSNGIDVGAATKVAQSLYAMFKERQAEERKRLLTLYPPMIHHAR